MPTIVSIVRVLHVVTAVLMAWPYYALVVVNQRARLGPPLGDRTDLYLENIIKNRTVPCFVLQATALASGLVLVLVDGGLATLWGNPVLGVKLLILVAMASALSYVHLRLQPQIDACFSQQPSPTGDLAVRIGALRLRRKRLAATCLFGVLASVILGVDLRAGLPLSLVLILTLGAALFAWRSFRSVTSYGWW